MKNKNIEIHELVWDGITIKVTLERGVGVIDDLMHCQIETIAPERMPLPITETGYRSHHFLPREGELDQGIVPLVRGWLDQEAERTNWKAHRVMAAQASLF